MKHILLVACLGLYACNQVGAAELNVAHLSNHGSISLQNTIKMRGIVIEGLPIIGDNSFKKAQNGFMQHASSAKHVLTDSSPLIIKARAFRQQVINFNQH